MVVDQRPPTACLHLDLRPPETLGAESDDARREGFSDSNIIVVDSYSMWHRLTMHMNSGITIKQKEKVVR